mmetsp:Transcript_49798/g.160366  ORF Transcript_49798/g.160366 Transcript_49798/m.160366 type:complete len:207 (+) Transcript_49798:628-1248(+)
MPRPHASHWLGRLRRGAQRGDGRLLLPAHLRHVQEAALVPPRAAHRLRGPPRRPRRRAPCGAPRRGVRRGAGAAVHHHRAGHLHAHLRERQGGGRGEVPQVPPRPRAHLGRADRARLPRPRHLHPAAVRGAAAHLRGGLRGRRAPRAHVREDPLRALLRARPLPHVGPLAARLRRKARADPRRARDADHLLRPARKGEGRLRGPLR